MTDRHLAAHAERPRALDDEIGREGAHLAGLVQVDVERLAVALAEREDGVEMSLRIAIDRAGVEPPTTSAPAFIASSISSSVPGRRSRPDCGKGHDFDIHDIAALLRASS